MRAYIIAADDLAFVAVPFHPRGKTSTTPDILLLRNDRKWAYLFIFYSDTFRTQKVKDTQNSAWVSAARGGNGACLVYKQFIYQLIKILEKNPSN